MSKSDIEKMIEDVADQLLVDLHTKQVKNRVPIFIAKRIDSWPSALSAVSYLKQCLNNADVGNAQLQAERDRYKEALEAIIKHNESIGMTGNYKLPMTTTVIAQKALGGSDE